MKASDEVARGPPSRGVFVTRPAKDIRPGRPLVCILRGLGAAGAVACCVGLQTATLGIPEWLRNRALGKGAGYEGCRWPNMQMRARFHYRRTSAQVVTELYDDAGLNNGPMVQGCAARVPEAQAATSATPSAARC